MQGDQLIATTGVTYGKEEYYGGAKVRKGQQVVRISALGQVGAGQTERSFLATTLHASVVIE